MWSTILQPLFFPGRCRLCHAPSRSHALCSDCERALPHLVHACPVCALPRSQRVPPRLPCGDCLSDPPPFDLARVPFLYRPPLNDLVAGFKYHQRLSDGRLLAELLLAYLCRQPQQVEMLLPVPLHPARLRRRGYNQAAELARVVSRGIGIPWRSDLLLRHQDGASQREASRRERLRNVRSAFRCEGAELPARVAVVDDVVTTGATARAAAACLKRAGVERVEIWALARTPRPGDA